MENITMKKTKTKAQIEIYKEKYHISKHYSGFRVSKTDNKTITNTPGRAIIVLEINYKRNEIKISPHSSETFHFLQSNLNLPKWRAVSELITEAINFAEQKLKEHEKEKNEQQQVKSASN